MHAPTLAHLLEMIRFRSQHGLPCDAGRLARDLRTSPTSVGTALLALEGRGLVDASRARLTMAGLAVAVALRTCRPALRLPRAA